MSHYIEGDLSAAARDRLEHHTEICPKCRRALRTLATLVLGLRRLRPVERPGLAGEVVERIRREPAETAGTRGR
jgi:anti-sigma factor RsiW